MPALVHIKEFSKVESCERYANDFSMKNRMVNVNIVPVKISAPIQITKYLLIIQYHR